MKGIYLGWAGERSRSVAAALAAWLRVSIPQLEIATADAGFDGAAVDRDAMHAALADVALVVLCVAFEERADPWLLYSAGACRQADRSCVLYLLDVERDELPAAISGLTAIGASRIGTARLLERLPLPDANASTRSELIARWPTLETELDRAREMAAPPTVQSQLSELAALIRGLAARDPDRERADVPERDHAMELSETSPTPSDGLSLDWGGTPSAGTVDIDEAATASVNFDFAAPTELETSPQPLNGCTPAPPPVSDRESEPPTIDLATLRARVLDARAMLADALEDSPLSGDLSDLTDQLSRIADEAEPGPSLEGLRDVVKSTYRRLVARGASIPDAINGVFDALAENLRSAGL